MPTLVVDSANFSSEAASPAVWPTLALILSLRLLPILKGGRIAYKWALRMHGFENAVRHGIVFGKSDII